MEYQFSSFQNTVCNFLEKCHAYNVLSKVEMTILSLTYRLYIYLYMFCLELSIIKV